MLKNPPVNTGDAEDVGLILGPGRFPWSRKWQLTPVFFPGEFHGQRSLAGYSPWDCKESDMTQWLGMHTHTHVFIRNWRFVAILHQVSPLVLFFPTAFAHFITLCHILVISIFLNIFHYYICCGDLWPGIFDVTTTTYGRFRKWLAFFGVKVAQSCVTLRSHGP